MQTKQASMPGLDALRQETPFSGFVKSRKILKSGLEGIASHISFSQTLNQDGDLFTSQLQFHFRDLSSWASNEMGVVCLMPWALHRTIHEHASFLIFVQEHALQDA